MLGGINPLWPWAGHFGSRAEWVWISMALILSGDISLAPTSGPSGDSRGYLGPGRWCAFDHTTDRGSKTPQGSAKAPPVGDANHQGASLHPEEADCVHCLPQLWAIQLAQLGGFPTEPAEETQDGHP